jgi:hypothetical protein
MKKLLISLLALGHVMAMQAMDPKMYRELEAMHLTSHRRVVPFDETTHGAKARSIFWKSFQISPPYLSPEDRVSAFIPESLRRTVDVLLLNKDVIGVIAYYDREENDGTATRLLDRLTIDEAHRGKPAYHGEFLVQKFEKKTLNEGITNIELVSYEKSLNFYKRLGYEQTSRHYDMIKTLTPTSDEKQEEYS